MTIKITAICGSVRPENATSKALSLVLDEFATHPDVEVTPVYLEELDLPLPGLPAHNPEALERLQKTVEDSTGVFLASPEYHGGVSSPMKLAIDNLSFPSKLAGKPVGLLGVAAGGIGAIKSLEQLRGICAHVGALVLPGSVSVAQVHRAFDERGVCQDEEVEKQIRSAATALVDYIRSAICPRVHQEAMTRDLAEPSPEGHEQEPRGRRGNTHASFRDARAEFERAWNQPGHTRIEPDAVDVNQLLAQSYSIDDGFRLTGQMLWDAEVAKAWDPGSYILDLVLRPLLSGLPRPVGLLASLSVSVSIMVGGVLPWLTRMFGGWLHPCASQETTPAGAPHANRAYDAVSELRQRDASQALRVASFSGGPSTQMCEPGSMIS